MDRDWLSFIQDRDTDAVFDCLLGRGGGGSRLGRLTRDQDLGEGCFASAWRRREGREEG